jgi:hypothetical protein
MVTTIDRPPICPALRRQVARPKSASRDGDDIRHAQINIGSATVHRSGGRACWSQLKFGPMGNHCRLRLAGD